MFDENIITAPGQPSADKLKNIYCGRNYLQEIRGRFLLPSPLQYLLINIIWMKQQHQKLQLGFILLPVFCYSTHNEKLATRCISPSQHYSHPYYVLLSYPCNWEWIIQFLIDTKEFLPSLQWIKLQMFEKQNEIKCWIILHGESGVSATLYTNVEPNLLLQSTNQSLGCSGFGFWLFSKFYLA